MSVTTGSRHSAINPDDLTQENAAKLLRLDPDFWDEEDYVASLVKIFGIRGHAVFVGEEDRDGWRCRHWRVTLRNRHTGRQTRTEYYAGMGISGEPTCPSVLWSIIRDADAFLGPLMFALKFETANAAFAERAVDEVAQILDHVSDLVQDGYTSGPLYDTNGNVVGDWSLDMPEEEA